MSGEIALVAMCPVVGDRICKYIRPVSITKSCGCDRGSLCILGISAFDIEG